MDCSTKLAKYLVFIFNLLFFLAGIALIVIGSLAITDDKDVYDKIVPNVPDVQGVAIVFLSVGGIITVISFFGCCGAMKESALMLNTFAILLILVVLCQIGGAIAAFVLRSNIKDSLTKSLSTYTTSTGGDWGDLQNTLKCCGVNGPADWKSNPIYSSGNSLPSSCCSSSGSGSCTTNSPNINSKGCYPAMCRYYVAIGAVGIAFGLIEIIGVVFACCLSKAVRYSTK